MEEERGKRKRKRKKEILAVIYEHREKSEREKNDSEVRKTLLTNKKNGKKKEKEKNLFGQNKRTVKRKKNGTDFRNEEIKENEKEKKMNRGQKDRTLTNNSTCCIVLCFVKLSFASFELYIFLYCFLCILVVVVERERIWREY